MKAGSTLQDVVDYLDQNELALGVLPAILEQTVAGAISTGIQYNWSILWYL